MNPLLAHTHEKKKKKRERKKETLALLEYSLLKPTRLTGNLWLAGQSKLVYITKCEVFVTVEPPKATYLKRQTLT